MTGQASSIFLYNLTAMNGIGRRPEAEFLPFSDAATPPMNSNSGLSVGSRGMCANPADILGGASAGYSPDKWCTDRVHCDASTSSRFCGRSTGNGRTDCREQERLSSAMPANGMNAGESFRRTIALPSGKA